MERKKIDTFLTIVFYILAVVAIVLYFTTADRTVDRMWMYFGFGAIGVRLITYITRFLM